MGLLSRRLRASIVFLSILLVAAGCARNPVTGKRELMIISEAHEQSIGAAAAPGIEAQFDGPYEDPVLSEYVNDVGQRLARVSHRPTIPYQYTVLNTSTPNAFALPGGYIYVTRGLLVRMQNEAQLAAVLGHETGHVAARHGAKHLQTAIGAALILEGIQIYDASRHEGKTRREVATAAAVGSAVFGLVQLGYSRSDEYEADRLGTEYTYKSQYNPLGMVELLQVLQQAGGREGSSLEEFFSTHPLTRKRIDEVRNEIVDRFPDSEKNPALAYHPEAFQQKTAGVRAAHKTYEKYDRAEERRRSGKPGEALGLYGEAIQERPQEPLFALGRGEALLALGRTGEAEADFRRAFGRPALALRAQYGLGRASLARRDFAGARRLLEPVVRSVPASAGPHFALAQAYRGLGMLPQARVEYANVLECADEGVEADAARSALGEIGPPPREGE
ncbi:MAG: M48 family metalloprotease [Planctomycetes bacterium]|nr:M48 family metalloprotease [Planctomycetota bacterium]